MDLTHTLHFGVTFGCGISHLHYILVSHRKDQKMSNPQNRRSLEQWMSIIQEARTSGMTDAQWCLVNGISRHSFNSAIKRLRRKACQLPAPSRKKSIDLHDLTVSKQEVVKVDIVNDVVQPKETIPANTMYLDNSHMIEIAFGDCKISLCNGADPVLVSKTISILRKFS